MRVDIRGYSVELELWVEDGEQRSECFIIRGQFSASLECLTSMGVLTSTDGSGETAVPAAIISQIEAWADKAGY